MLFLKGNGYTKKERRKNHQNFEGAGNFGNGTKEKIKEGVRRTARQDAKVLKSRWPTGCGMRGLV